MLQRPAGGRTGSPDSAAEPSRAPRRQQAARGAAPGHGDRIKGRDGGRNAAAPFGGLPERREERLGPAFRGLFERTRADGAIESDIGAADFLYAAGHLCLSVQVRRPEQARRLVGRLVQGLRHA